MPTKVLLDSVESERRAVVGAVTRASTAMAVMWFQLGELWGVVWYSMISFVRVLVSLAV